MWLILILTIGQAVSSTLAWIGFYAGVRTLPGARARQARWIIGSAVVGAAWLVGVFLLGAADIFRNDALPPRIPMALAATRLPGYLLLVSPAFRRIVAAVPQHWVIGIQTFRILGGVWLARYFAGQLPGLFALPAGIGDVATGLLAPFVAYARGIAASLMRAVQRSHGKASAWPIWSMPWCWARSPAAARHRLPDRAHSGLWRAGAFLIHSYSLIRLLRKTSQRLRRAESFESRNGGGSGMSITRSSRPNAPSHAAGLCRET